MRKFIFTLLGIVLCNTMVFGNFIKNVHTNKTYSNLQQAINEAQHQNTLWVYPGVYSPIVFSKQNISIEVIAVQGPHQTSISGFGTTTAVRFYNTGSTYNLLKGFTIENGKGIIKYSGETSGGGILCQYSNVFLENLIIKNNTADKGAGIFFISCNNKPQCKYLLIHDNHSTKNLGGGVYAYFSNPEFHSTTIANNQGGGIYAYMSNSSYMSKIENSIVAKNNAFDYQCPQNYSLIKAYSTLGGEPNFVSIPYSNFRLNWNSPCINAGNPSISVTDEPWPHGNIVNQGYYGNTSEAAISRINVPEQAVTIQQAIDLANDGFDIIVNDGTYDESLSISGKRLSITSVNGSESTIINNISSERGIYINNSNKEVEIHGFSIIDCGRIDQSGGGIYCAYADVDLKDIKIDKNHALHGAGLYLYRVQGSIEDIDITFCQSYGYGGGIFMAYCDPLIIENIYLSQNRASSGMGGIYSYASDLVINNGVFDENGSATGMCGFMRIYSSSVEINNSIISENGSISKGVLSVEGNSSLDLNRVLMYGNISENGIDVLGNSSIDFSFSTLAYNAPYLRIQDNSTFISRNSIIWNAIDVSETAVVDVDYSNLEDWPISENNTFSADPRFVATHDFHILPNSPCVDAGYYEGELLEPQPNGDIVNIGYYANTVEATPTVPITINVPGDYFSIQRAIDASKDGDEILIGADTYHEWISFKNKSITLKSIDGSANTTIDATGTNKRAVTIPSAPNVTFEGFTVINGNGGVHAAGSNMTLRDLIIENNTTSGDYGGIFVSSNQNAIVENIKIRNNSAENYAGGYINCPYGKAENIIVENNTANKAIGGLMVILDELKNTNIQNNTASNEYAGIVGSCAKLTNVSIVNNIASVWSAGRLLQSELEMDHVLIANNSPYPGGLASFQVDGDNFAGNHIYSITNSTITDYFSIYQGLASDNLTIRNSIIRGALGTSQISVYPTYSNILNWSGSETGMIDVDPLFVDVSNHDFHLIPESDCIDAGDPNDDWSLEPDYPNGQINMGFYGNTDEATIASAFKSGNMQDESLSLVKGQQQEISIYPNPNNGIFNLSGLQNASVSIYSIDGRKVFSSHHLSESVEINISEQEPNVYLLQIDDIKGQKTFRFVVSE